jgi:hypothetical protein
VYARNDLESRGNPSGQRRLGLGPQVGFSPRLLRLSRGDQVTVLACGVRFNAKIIVALACGIGPGRTILSTVEIVWLVEYLNRKDGIPQLESRSNVLELPVSLVRFLPRLLSLRGGHGS